jgi:hypothetical protein
MAVLDEAHRQRPTDRGVLMALVSIASDTGNLVTAFRHRELAALDPADTATPPSLGSREKGSSVGRLKRCDDLAQRVPLPEVGQRQDPIIGIISRRSLAKIG